MESSKYPSPALGALLGALLALPWMALSFLANQLLGLPFPPFVLFDWIARTLPGDLITMGIDSIVAMVTTLGIGPISDAAKSVERFSALVIFLGLLTFTAGAIAVRAQRRKRLELIVPFGATLVLTVMMLLVNGSLGFGPAGWVASALWYLILFLAWSFVLAWLFRLAPAALADEPESPMSRREFIYLMGGGVLTISVGSLAVTRMLQGGDGALVDQAAPEYSDLAGTSGQAASPSTEELSNRVEAAPGTRPEITSNEDFYNVDINTLPPSVNGDSWRLTIDGLVQAPAEFTMADLHSRPAISQVITLSCISNPIGGDLIGTAVWTGVPFSHILEEVGVQSGAVEVRMEAEDGFYESVSLTDAMDPRTLLVYEMNGEPLPKEHGFPLRIYIPDRYGMKQPKWITHMEVIDREGDGYWVDRGWSEEAYVRTTSVVDTVNGAAESQTFVIGGIAYAGAKGISRVEVQIDEGPWNEAELRTPALSPLTWVQWRYDWPVESGRHTIHVRAYDASGQLQVEQSGGARPDGATGIHELVVNI